VSLTQRLKIAFKATRELGLTQVGLYVYYQFSLRLGLFRLMTPPQEPLDIETASPHELANDLVIVPTRDDLAELIGENASALLSQATDIDDGKVRLFGGPPQDLNLIVPLPLEHWTNIAKDHSKAGAEDIKFIWEPARFTWVYPLARAFQLSEDESFAETFWRDFETFQDINIANMGPNWASGQEVALRLIALTFAYQVFRSSSVSTEDRISRLSIAIAEHAVRIPPTLIYARAQNNNHLLTESAGLFTAGLCIPKHPKAQKWRQLGWRWFNHALQTQISSDGTYIQHSTNYHRLMLQVALWVYCLEGSFPEETTQRLAAATEWLLTLVDPETGRVPNLGHNDGSYIQPLASCSFHDYRPVMQAAALVFLDRRPYPPGPWDELSLWLGITGSGKEKIEDQEGPPLLKVTTYPESHAVLHNMTNQTWASFRVAKFHARPAHADQLHLDLWWRGLNLAQDAGTYFYNAPPPWDNSLALTGIHNTVTIDDRDQMSRAGRFLWLDWAQAQIIQNESGEDGASHHLVAQHDGYRKFGVIHQRGIHTTLGGNWVITDNLLPVESHPQKTRHADGSREEFSSHGQDYRARLHWLLPDWSWEFEQLDDKFQTIFRLRSPTGWIDLKIGIEPAPQGDGEIRSPLIDLFRAGESLLGSDQVSPILGWVSPTYGYKVPALSLAVIMESSLPLRFTTELDLPNNA